MEGGSKGKQQSFSSIRCMGTDRSFIVLIMAAWAYLGVMLISTGWAAGQSKPDLPALPVAPIRPVTDVYFGTQVVDPYRYMENLKDPQVQAWMKAENDYTRAVLAQIPGREKLLERIRQLDQTVPQVQAVELPVELYLISKRLPMENVAKLYLRHGLNGPDKLLVDPEELKLVAPNQHKGTNVILYFSASQDARYVAVGIAPGGAERDTELHVFDIRSGRPTGDVILRAWYMTGWLPGDRSFVYERFQTLPPGAPATEIEQKVRAYLHVLGRNPKNDPAVFGYGAVPTIHVDPRYFSSLSVQPNCTYVIGSINSGVSPNSAFYIEPLTSLGSTNSAWRKVAALSDDVQDIEIHGNDLYLLTYKNALRYKVLRTEARNPNLVSAETVVAPSRAVVTSINPAQDALYVQLLDGGIGRVLRVPYGPRPNIEEVPLPFKGTVGVQTDPRLPGALLTLTSWTKAYRIYAYDPGAKGVVETELQPAGPYDNPASVESVEVNVRSYDGTLVPLSIVYPKGMNLDGSNPALLYGYGGYAISITPSFYPTRLAWFEEGGIYAVCPVRGGDEYGEEWHLAGKGPTKPNTWRDFIACVQYLINHKYTSPARLAGEGGSAGGILIGRAISSRPDLFAAAIDVVGVSDTLRAETTANGVPNVPELGSVKTKAGFEALDAMSPYDHVRDKTHYPAVLLETGANDPRVDPWESAKMTARLQAATSSGKPVLLRVEYQGGHGGIGGTEAQMQEVLADNYSFLLWQFGMSGFQPARP